MEQHEGVNHQGEIQEVMPWRFSDQPFAVSTRQTAVSRTKGQKESTRTESNRNAQAYDVHVGARGFFFRFFEICDIVGAKGEIAMGDSPINRIPVYDSSTKYAPGDLCLYNGVVYMRSPVHIYAFGPFNPDHWTTPPPSVIASLLYKQINL